MRSKYHILSSYQVSNISHSAFQRAKSDFRRTFDVTQVRWAVFWAFMILIRNSRAKPKFKFMPYFALCWSTDWWHSLPVILCFFISRSPERFLTSSVLPWQCQIVKQHEISEYCCGTGVSEWLFRFLAQAFTYSAVRAHSSSSTVLRTQYEAVLPCTGSYVRPRRDHEESSTYVCRSVCHFYCSILLQVLYVLRGAIVNRTKYC